MQTSNIPTPLIFIIKEIYFHFSQFHYARYNTYWGRKWLVSSVNRNNVLFVCFWQHGAFSRQRLKSLTVIQFSNPFQTNVWAADIYFPCVRSCELSSVGKFDLWSNRSNSWWSEGSARSQGWDPAAPPLFPWVMNGTELLSSELETQTCAWWIKEGLWWQSDVHSLQQEVSFRDPKSSEIQCSFLASFFPFLFYDVSMSTHPLPYPTIWAVYQPATNPPAGHCATLASLKGLGCFTGISWIQTLEDKEETVSRSFHVSPSCLPIRVKIWFHSWKVLLFPVRTVK